MSYELNQMRERVKALRLEVAQGNKRTNRLSRLRHSLAVIELAQAERQLSIHVRKHGIWSV